MTAEVSPTARERTRRMTTLSSLPLAEISSAQGPGLRAELSRLWGYRELMDLLVRRELKIRYKDSSLGFLWSLLRPLALLLVYYVAVGKFLGAQRAIPDFAIHLFCGLTLWQLLVEVLSSSTASILANSALVKKVNLPLEVFPLSTVGSALVNFGIQLMILIVATILTGAFPTGTRWLYAPLSILVVLAWATGLGLMLSAVNVYLRDVQYLVEIVLMVGFWACPVAYSWEQVSHTLAKYPIVQDIYLANPVALAVLGFQRTFWVGGTNSVPPPHLELRLFIMLGIGLVLVWLGQRLFQRMSGSFAQEL